MGSPEDNYVKQCKYYHWCGLNGIGTTDLCVLHSNSHTKSVEKFNEALATYCSKDEDDFSHIVFPPGAVFPRNRFSGFIDFKLAEFHGTADFTGATFAGEVDFRNARFMKDVQFSEATFERGVRFEGITFPEDADFSRAVFGEERDQSEGQADEADSYTEDEPTKSANFYGANFTKKANFGGVHFSDVEADFGHVKFDDEAIFRGVEFAEKAKQANFLAARFKRKANFIKAKFPSGVNFVSAEFEEGASFLITAFADLVLFDDARFLGRTLFEPEEGQDEDLIFSKAEQVFFTNVTLEPLEAVTFRDADLTKCRFLGTDLRKVEITNAKWPEMDRPFPLLRKRSGVYDEIAPLGRDKTRAWSHIERVYRELKQNYEDRRDYERASDFHYGEKEMRRKNPETSYGLKLLLYVYWLVSGYGERVLLPFVWAVVLWMACAIGYHAWGLSPRHQSATPVVISVWDYLDYSLRVMTLLKPEDLIPNGCAKYVNTAESLLGPLLIGLFALTLRQRLKR